MITKSTKLKVATLSLFTALVTTNTIAAPGPYVSAQLGYGDTNISDFSTSESSGLAGRLAAGYQINPYFAAELGWTGFSNAEASDTSSAASSEGIVTATADTTVKTSALDLVGKATYPVNDKMDIYGKLGVAYVMQTTNVDGTLTIASQLSPVTEVYGVSDNYNEYAWLPTFGIGANYHFTPRLAADVSYNRIQQVGDTTIESTDFVGVGLTYSLS